MKRNAKELNQKIQNRGQRSSNIRITGVPEADAKRGKKVIIKSIISEHFQEFKKKVNMKIKNTHYISKLLYRTSSMKKFMK